MNITEKELKLIEKYLDESLSEEQGVQFNLAIESEVFREQLMFQAKLVDVSKSIGQDKLRQQIETLAQSKKKKPVNRRNMFILIGIIGVFLCFYLSNRMMQSDSKGTDLYAQYFVELPPDVNKRGLENKFTLEYQQAMQYYIDKDYHSALLAFENLAGGSEGLDLYKAMCQMKLNKSKTARGSLMPLLISKEMKIQQNAQWYLILMNIREGDFIQAKQSLDEVLDEEDHLFYRQALKLKADLD